MNTTRVWLFIGLLLSVVCANSWGTECRFFRIRCLDGGAPENLAITTDEFGQIFLAFNTRDQRTYVIETTDSLSPPPAWTGASAIVGHGKRVWWLTTRRWSTTFGGSDWEMGHSATQTSDGGFIVAGFTLSFGAGQGDMYLIKTDRDGNEVWSRTLGGTLVDDAYSVRQTSDGGYIVAGWTMSAGAEFFDVYLIKTDAEGNEEWSRTYGGSEDDRGECVQQTSDGGYILAGWTKSFGHGSDDVYLVKTNSDGNEVWSRTFGGSQDDWGHSVQQTSDGGYILAGSTESFGAGETDAYLIKTDENGDAGKGKGWTATFGGSGADGANSAQQTSDGGYILAGATYTSGADDPDVYLVKTDADGNELWSRTFGGTWDDWANSVQQTSDGGYIVAGYTYSFGAGYGDAYLVKTDEDGNELWSRTLGGAGQDYARSVQQTCDGGYILAGTTGSFGAGDLDVYVIKTDRNGNAPPPEPTLISVVVLGPDEVNENSSADYTATAVWGDGSTQDVTDSTSWSPTSGTHYFSSAGHLVTGDVSSNESIALSASYDGQTAVKNITVIDVPAKLTSVTISRPGKASGDSLADYAPPAHRNGA